MTDDASGSGVGTTESASDESATESASDGPAVASDEPIDAAALDSFLRRQVGEPVVETASMSDGLNRVVAVTTTTSEYVLRQPQKLRDTSYMNELRSEYRLLATLQIPTPEPVAFCENGSDTPFFLMERRAGTTIPFGSRLPERFQSPSDRRQLARSLIDTLAAIHKPTRDTAHCGSRSVAAGIRADLDRIERREAATGFDASRLRAVGHRLLRAAPPTTRQTLTHGDYRPGNVLVADQPVVSTVLDWETATMADPMVDVGYFLLRWRDETDTRLSIDELADQYPPETLAELRERNAEGMAPFTTEPGSPSREQLVARYERQTGFDVQRLTYYRALAAFQLASVWLDLHWHRVTHDEPSDYPPTIDYMTLVADTLASE